MNEPTAVVTDLFSSFQGEGTYLGVKQIFVRFSKCNARCSFCDEQKPVFNKKFTPKELLNQVKVLNRLNGPHHSVSLTGGEPLMYPKFLKVFLKLLKAEGFTTYLETNGTLPEALSTIIDMTDIIAMDFKLPSSTGSVKYWDKHEKFLKVASKKEVFVKIVVTPNTSDEDVKHAVALIRHADKKVGLVIQPATPLKREEKTIDQGRLLNMASLASKGRVKDVKIIPQVHKMLNFK